MPRPAALFQAQTQEDFPLCSMPQSPGFGTVCTGRKLADPSARSAPLSKSGRIGVSRLGRARASFPGRAPAGRLARAPDGHALLATEGGAAKTLGNIGSGRAKCATAVRTHSSFPARRVSAVAVPLSPGHACGGCHHRAPEAGGGSGLSNSARRSVLAGICMRGSRSRQSLGHCPLTRCMLRMAAPQICAGHNQGTCRRTGHQNPR